MKYRILILRRAEADLRAILDWLYRRSPAGAERWYEAFLAAVVDLESAPFSLPLVPEKLELPLPIRDKSFKTPRGRKYRILFVIANTEVRILRIRGPGQRPIADKDVI